jgi:uncharacterized YigZ family protein
MSAVKFALAAPARFAQEIRKSKFLANAAQVASEAAASDFLNQVSDAGASHHCWAWRVGQRYRFSDDGEPAGTAGRPILQAIDAQAMDCTAVVVSRWFGGIKLGAGGLMRAYGGCAAQCLREASKVPLIDSVNVEFAADFSLLATLRSRLSALDATVTAEDFAAAGALMRVRLPAAHLPQLRQLLADLSRGRVELRQID